MQKSRGRFVLKIFGALLLISAAALYWFGRPKNDQTAAAQGEEVYASHDCTDCHLSAADDNNAIMSQLLLMGTNFVNFVGLNVWSGQEDSFQATRVTEWDEPQAVIGSYLQKYAYPDYWDMHVNKNGRELKNWVRGKTFDSKGS